MLRSVTATTISTDSWTSTSGHSYTGILVHFMSSQFIYTTLCVGLINFDKSNYKKTTAVALAAQLEEQVDDFPKNCAGQSILSLCNRIVADGANVMPAMALKLQKPYTHCIGHRLQLVLKDFVLQIDDLCVSIGMFIHVVIS